MLYRKKPVLVDAFKFTDDSELIAPDWFTQAVKDRSVTIKRKTLNGHASVDGCIIKTLEGDHLARIGDYIIRGVAGELYPCKPDIFTRTYEPASQGVGYCD